jgi:hypothetical protein
VLTSQKNQYEDRLKRVYDEKDSMIMQCAQLQNELNTLQEKLMLQTEQHQYLLTQQHTRHEQSQTRWLTLIDHANQETKKTYKRLENLHCYSDGKIKKIKAELTELRQNTHEKKCTVKNFS